jgi:hypothetical protein
MPSTKRQINSDRPTLTRAEAAKHLGRDISWIRRHEGRDLHPTLQDGVNHFDPEEVERLRARLQAEDAATQVSDDVRSLIHAAFHDHARGARHTLDSIAMQTGLEPRAVKRMHAAWAETQLGVGQRAVPALLSRAELLAKDDREALEIERYYDDFMIRSQREWEQDRLCRGIQPRRVDPTTPLPSRAPARHHRGR